MTEGRGRIPPALQSLGYFVLCLALCATLHWVRGAMGSDFGAHDDESAHVVTGMMMRDYLTSGALSHPVRFAEEYYLHYPKVAIGHWPPVFYLLQALWTWPLGTSAVSLVTLMSVLTASVSLMMFVATRRACGVLIAGFAGLLFVFLPLVQKYGSMVMTEVPLALFCLAAALQFGRFLDTGRLRHSLGFGGCAVLAIMTKGNGLALALLPPVAIAISGRWKLVRRPALWLSALPVVVICGPWYWNTLSISVTTWTGAGEPSWSYFATAGGFYARAILGLAGIGVTVSAILGTAVAGRTGEGGKWAAVTALVPAVVAFHAIIPSSLDPRHLVLLAPAWVMLAALGVAALSRASTVSPRVSPAVAGAAVGLAALFAAEVGALPGKEFHGFGGAVRGILADERNSSSVLLVASDAPGEGMFVSSVAMQEQRPGHIVLRAEKVLAHSDWFASHYRPRFADMGEMRNYLRKIPVGVVAVDVSGRPNAWREHHTMLRTLVENDAAAWEHLGARDVVRDGVRHPGALRLYRQNGHENLPRTELTIDQVIGDRLR